MRPASAIVLLALSACGGGGGSGGFTPSTDLAASHPWLVGTWTGTARITGSTADYSTLLFVDSVSGAISQVRTVGDATGWPRPTAVIQAGGDRVVLEGSDFRAEGTVRDRWIMDLTWTAGSVSGTASLTRSGGPLQPASTTVVVVDEPGLLVVYRLNWRQSQSQ